MQYSSAKNEMMTPHLHMNRSACLSHGNQMSNFRRASARFVARSTFLISQQDTLIKSNRPEKEKALKDSNTMSRPLRVFKFSHDELAALLPKSAFGSLDTALPVVCQAMCHDGSFDESDIRLGLEQALQILDKPPALVLRGIRLWALEFLRDTTSNNEIFFGPLDCHPPSNSEEFETRTRAVTTKQARGILANAFFANCLDTMETQKDKRNSGGLDWRRLLQTHSSEGLERMRCHLLYFEAISTDTDLDRRIIFERIRYEPLNFTEDHIINNTNTHLPVGHGIVLHNNVMEKPTRKCSAFVNFANANFGYVLVSGWLTNMHIWSSYS